MKSAVAIDTIGEDIVILDSAKNHFVLFRPTAYVTGIHRAQQAYSAGRFAEAGELWDAVLRKNGNLGLAYSGLGQIAYNQREYDRAAQYFHLANDREGFAKAQKYIRKDLFDRVFPPAVIAAAVLTAGLWLWRAGKRRRNKSAGKAG